MSNPRSDPPPAPSASPAAPPGAGNTSAATPGAPLLCLTGPTASGKSAVALYLAEKLGGEIVSADSMQVYRGLDLGTAKPSPEDRARVPHHLLDVATPDESFNAARWAALARATLAEIRRRDRLPVVCGGTGLYFKALLVGLDPTPPADPTVRTALEARPLPDLLAELEQRDPAEFAAIDRANPRRVVRALEVIHLTGRPFSAQKTGRARVAGPVPAVIALRRRPANLRCRIERRVDEMFARGLVEETRRLLELGLERNRTAAQALGYRQVIEHLRGARDLAETLALVKLKTWQFARRQMTWWRRQLPVTWIDVTAEESAEATAMAVERAWRSAGTD